MKMTGWKMLVLAALMALGAGGCADGVAGKGKGTPAPSNNEDNNDNPQPTPVDLDSPGSTQRPPSGDTTSRPIFNDRNRLEIIGSSQLALNYINTTELAVRYLDHEGQPVRGSDLTFTFEGGGGDNLLSPAVSPTNRDGVARTTLTSGTTRGEWRLKVTASLADPVFYTLRVTPKDNAAYIVHTEYEGVTQPTLVSVRLLPSAVRCADVRPQTLPEALENFDILPTPEGIPDARFVNLPNGTGYTVVSLGLMSREAQVAWGCNDEGAPIRDGFDTEVTVVMEELAPQVVGTYDIETRVDLTDALPEPWRTNINIIGRIFADPAGLVVDLLLGVESDPNDEGLVGEFLNFIPGIRGLLENVVNEFLRDVLPSDVRRVFDIGGTAYRAVTQFTLGGQLQIMAEPDEQGFLATTNIHRYGQIIINWDVDCMPGDPPECGDIVLSMNRLQEVGALSGRFGGVVSRDVEGSFLLVDRHSFSFNYGALLLALFEQLILPEIFGPGVDTLGEAVETLFDCRDVADGVFDPINDAFLNQLLFNGCREALGEFEGLLVDLIVSNDTDFPALTIGTFEAQTEDEIYEQGCPLKEPLEYAPGQRARRYERLGSAQDRCVWDARLEAGGEVRELTSDFYGARQ